MIHDTCSKCERHLNKSDIKKRAKSCHICISAARIELIQTTSFLNTNFEKKWSATLFKNYILYLSELNVKVETIRKHGNKVLKLFQLAEKEHLEAFNISEEWLLNTIEINKNLKGIKAGLFNFLVKEKIINFDDDRKLKATIVKSIESLPKGFRRLLDIYYNERIELRERQLKFQARAPLSLLTVKTNMANFVRLVRWFYINRSYIVSWDGVQQEDVHTFLLTLTPKNREIVRKDLLVLFKLAKRKKIITHIPILDITSRELPPTIEPLTFDEQREVALKLRVNIYEKPLECLLISLCFYHGLSSKMIKEIKVRDLDIDRTAIHIGGRAPVFLSTDEMLMVQEYIKLRNIDEIRRNKRYLIVSFNSSTIYEDKPVSNRFIRKKVKDLTNFSPKAHRITCFNVIASNFGPQLLVEGFGVSLTQASRYGKLEEYLIEEQIELGRSIFECT